MAKLIIGALLTAFIYMVAYTWTGLAEDVEQNTEDIDTLEEVVTEIRANQEADARVQATQTVVLQGILNELKKQP